MGLHTKMQYICMSCGQEIKPKIASISTPPRFKDQLYGGWNEPYAQERSKTQFNLDNGAFWNGQSITSMDINHIKNTIMFLERKFLENSLNRRYESISNVFPAYLYLKRELNRR